jgi:hypothetical protein
VLTAKLGEFSTNETLFFSEAGLERAGDIFLKPTCIAREMRIKAVSFKAESMPADDQNARISGVTGR